MAAEQEIAAPAAEDVIVAVVTVDHVVELVVRSRHDIADRIDYRRDGPETPLVEGDHAAIADQHVLADVGRTASVRQARIYVAAHQVVAAAAEHDIVGRVTGHDVIAVASRYIGQDQVDGADIRVFEVAFGFRHRIQQVAQYRRCDDEIVVDDLGASAELGHQTVVAEHDIVARAADHEVVARAAEQDVGFGLAEDLVVVRVAEDHVGAAVALHDVVAGVAVNVVVAGTAGDDVVTVVAGDDVGLVVAEDVVVAAAAEDFIEALAGKDEVAATVALDQVVAAAAEDHVAVGAAFDYVVAAEEQVSGVEVGDDAVVDGVDGIADFLRRHRNGRDDRRRHEGCRTQTGDIDLSASRRGPGKLEAPAVADKDVAAGITEYLVVATGADGDIVAVAAVDFVDAVSQRDAAGQVRTGGIGGINYSALVTEKDVMTAAALDIVVALAAGDDVIAVAAGQAIIADAADDGTTALAAADGDDIVSDAAVEFVGYGAVGPEGHGDVVIAMTTDADDVAKRTVHFAVDCHLVRIADIHRHGLRTVRNVAVDAVFGTRADVEHQVPAANVGRPDRVVLEGLVEAE